MDWASLPDVVQRLHDRLDNGIGFDDAQIRLLAEEQGQTFFKMKVATLAMAEHGATIFEAPELINTAALALTMHPRLVVHEISPAAAHLLADVDLRTLPDEPPSLLQSPWIIRVRNPDRENLFGEGYPELAGYQVDGVYFLIGLQYPDGCLVAQWKPTWGGGDLAEGTQQHDSSLVAVEAEDQWRAWAHDAARFSLLLGIMLDANKAPVTARDKSATVPGRKRRKSPKDWSVRRIGLRSVSAPQAQNIDGSSEPMPPGYVPASSRVSGHLRRQPCGPGLQDRQWIWVDEYSARRWVAPRMKIRVGPT